jgi:hypothetical protein
MINFYKHENCPDCDEFEEKLIEIVIAHNVCSLKSKTAEKLQLNNASIIEGKIKVSGHREIRIYIREIIKIMQLWQKFQSDACYLDDDNKIC